MMGSTASLQSNILTFPIGPKRHAPQKKCTTDDVYAYLLEALLDQRIHQGAELKASWIRETFGVGKYIVDNVLARLAKNNLISLQSGSTAQVIALKPESNRQAFEARRIAEVNVITLLTRTCTSKDAQTLRTLITQERQYAQRRMRSSNIRMAAMFHQRLADLTRNKPLIQFVNTLIPVTSLMIAQNAQEGSIMEMWRTHTALVDALEARSSDRAIDLIKQLMAELENLAH